jgi:hypothetical protein
MIAKMNSRKIFITIAASTAAAPHRVERSPVEHDRTALHGATRWVTAR